jgi:hypothetical protein
MADDQSAGAMPVVPGATPGQIAAPAADPAVAAPATGDDGLADGGKRALDAERAQRREAEKRAKAATDELEALRASQLSEHEKAIALARKEALAEAMTKAHAMVRRAEVRRALASAGIVADSLELAAAAREFATLDVDDDGQVVELDKAVGAFRSAHPSLFAAARPAAGNFDGGSGGASAAQSWTRDQIGQMSQAEFEKNETEIMRAMREGRIRDQ